MLSLSCLSLNKTSSKQVKLDWLHDNYIILHTILQNYEGVTQSRGMPSIKELVYYENTTSLNGVPVRIAKRLLDHRIFDTNETEIGLVYYKYMICPFFFICKEFLELFGHYKHTYFSQLKDKFNNWKYNLQTQIPNVDEDSRDIIRDMIFSLIESLKALNFMDENNNNNRTFIQYRLIIQYSCLYQLSKLTLYYKNLLSNPEQNGLLDMKGQIDMKIFNIDISRPFDYDVVHIYQYMYSSELIYKCEISRFRTIIKSGWKQEKPDECPVCLESINDNEYLSCGHYVHKCCFLKSKKTCCPICKKEVELEVDDIKQMFLS
jgi:hypothetical protein